MGDAYKLTVLTLKRLAGDFLLKWPLSHLPSRAKQVNSKVSISAFIAGADVLKHTSTNKIINTLFSFIFAGLKFRENFLSTFRESLISRSWRKIVFAGNLIS